MKNNIPACWSFVLESVISSWTPLAAHWNSDFLRFGWKKEIKTKKADFYTLYSPFVGVDRWQGGGGRGDGAGGKCVCVSILIDWSINLEKVCLCFKKTDVVSLSPKTKLECFRKTDVVGNCKQTAFNQTVLHPCKQSHHKIAKKQVCLEVISPQPLRHSNMSVRSNHTKIQTTKCAERKMG